MLIRRSGHNEPCLRVCKSNTLEGHDPIAGRDVVLNNPPSGSSRRDLASACATALRPLPGAPQRSTPPGGWSSGLMAARAAAAAGLSAAVRRASAAAAAAAAEEPGGKARSVTLTASYDVIQFKRTWPNGLMSSII